MNRSVPMISFSGCLMLVNREAIDFCKLILYPATLHLMITSRSFLVEFLGSPIERNILSANEVSVTSSFPICIPLISFSGLIAPTTTSNTVLKRSRDHGHPCLIPDFCGIALIFSLFMMILTVGFSCVAFIVLRYVLSSPTLSKPYIIFTASFEMTM